MTYKEASRDVVILGGHVYDIGFYDGDERQFVAFGSRDLEQLWNDFCDKKILKGIALTISNWYKNRRMKWRI